MNEPTDKVRKVIGKIIALEISGPVVPDKRVLARHPALANELPDALQSLQAIRSAEIQSQAAGEILEPLELCSDQELDAPIVCDDLEPPDEATSPENSESIVGYRLLEWIGRGGQANVYRAQKISTKGVVAIKVLPGGFFASSRARARFEREALALVQVHHPNIVPVLDKGRTRDGSHFIVMAYVEGLPPDRYFANNKNERHIAGVFAKIASAVHEMHLRGIVHRDLKPSNVLVDRFGEPHILDFGLARLSESKAVTDTGQILGSLAWASPEQADGRSSAVNEFSDIYSLGVMLAVVLDGEPPYPTSGGLLEIARHIAETPPVVGRNRAPGILDGIALKCLSKQQSGRYANASELAQQFCSVESGTILPVVSARRRFRRRGTIVLIGLAILTAAFLNAYSRLNQFQTAFRAQQIPQSGSTVIELPNVTNSIGMRFVQIPKGDFLMQCSNADRKRGVNPQTLQHIQKPFYLAVTETTRSQYHRIMSDDARIKDPDLPAANVSFGNALEFCRRLNLRNEGFYRLPTQIEWEYACQAAAVAKNLSDAELKATAWYQGNSGGKLQHVATLKPNRWGLYDMLGSVSEWCIDSQQIATGDAITPTTPAIMKGGCYLWSPLECSAAEGIVNHEGIILDYCGLRVILDLPEKK